MNPQQAQANALRQMAMRPAPQQDDQQTMLANAAPPGGLTDMSAQAAPDVRAVLNAAMQQASQSPPAPSLGAAPGSAPRAPKMQRNPPNPATAGRPPMANPRAARGGLTV